MCFVFGGLANGSKEARSNIPIYLNDLYQIDLRNTKNTEWAITPVCLLSYLLKFENVRRKDRKVDRELFFWNL